MKTSENSQYFIVRKIKLTNSNSSTLPKSYNLSRSTCTSELTSKREQSNL